MNVSNMIDNISNNVSDDSNILSSYVINLPLSGAVVNLKPESFSLATNGKLCPQYPCNIMLSYDAHRQAIVIKFNNTNNPFVDDNNYTQDNSDMWNQEVFEIFIAPGSDTPIKYVEIELNPNNALFSAWVDNPDGRGSLNTLSYFDGRESGIQAGVLKGADSWSGEIVLPLAILGELKHNYRINFFRVASFARHDKNINWSRSLDTCKFLAWSPTFSGIIPDYFHLPRYFGYLNLLV